ncbi:class I SAM-dependent methyltransferase [Ammoniphilus sp. CFH 90114]|uniref:class I SAM-dependent methyltransferase n=1 Tax=Ammoniphilus sp. CFH 90114 TaxID=2493665 RepID=UPI00100DA897|nr:class I SAM-dependent methyltransferase [Ammoniphilus sp. CFH 90114]RXT03902.1 class I SAM-dependent methyltransferase [Ammoniphilus sp. CFH 90114]
MNNQWNKMIYKIWSPFYDKIFNSGAFLKAREKLVKDIELFKGKRILFVGVGTGADLERIQHRDYEITAIDFSKDMLDKAKQKFNQSSIEFLEMDAQKLEFEEESFDLVVGSLILSVVPDADKALKEMVRVTKQGGEILLFDKFAPKNKQISVGKKLIRPLISLLGTDIGLNFEQTFARYIHSVAVQADEPVMFGDMYRKIKLLKVRKW